jgi:hypothetical protein
VHPGAFRLRYVRRSALGPGECSVQEHAQGVVRLDRRHPQRMNGPFFLHVTVAVASSDFEGPSMSVTM